MVPDNYPSIQAAIKVASTGDTIFVRNGTYYEHVVINKTLIVLGESSTGTVIDGSGLLGNVVEVVSSNVVLRGFTVQNGGMDNNSCLVKMVRPHFCCYS